MEEKEERDKETLDTDTLMSDNASASEEIVPEEEGENTAVLIKRLREKLAACQKEKREYLDGWQRSKADFINAQKGFKAEMASLMNFAESGLIAELLPVLDSFYAAKKNKEAWEKVPSEWRQGVEFIEQQLLGILSVRGLQIIDPLGETFNHEEHEAIGESAGKEADKIVEVRQPGYKLKGKVLRPARVVVSK